MKVLKPEKVFVQYRGLMKPYDPIAGRTYTITHSDTTGELFVFIDEKYALDQITRMRDEVRVTWKQEKNRFVLLGSVLVDGEDVFGNAFIRNKIFYNEMPTALQALRQADRFLFMKEPELDVAPVIIHFVSNNPIYNKTYDFGMIGSYR